MPIISKTPPASGLRLNDLSEFKVMEWLFWLRNLMALTQLCAMLFVIRVLHIPLQVLPISIAPLALLLFNLFVYWRLKNGKRATVFEISAHLMFDMLVFTYLMYWTGGSVNPFISAYLVPIAMAAAFGGLRHVLVLGLASMAFYSFLMLHHVPLPPVHSQMGGDFSLHVVGMWLNFILSATITIIFVSGLARLAHKREIALKQAEQQSLNDQHMVALGALAAGAAHELGTPLSNIRMLADEIIEPDNDTVTAAVFAESLKEQVAICQTQISRLREQANHAQHPQPIQSTVDEFVKDALDRFKAMRSEVTLKLHAPTDCKEMLVYDISLGQTVLSLLNNAADASVENGYYEIEVSYEVRGGELCLNINDFGSGLNPEYASLMGTAPFSTKNEGVGIGLLLARANIERMGGRLTLSDRINTEIGVSAEMKLPLISMQHA